MVPKLGQLTCDDAGEGAAHSHRGEGRGGAAEGRHDGGRTAEGRETSRVTVVAVVVRLHGRGVTHAGGVGPIVAQVGIGGHGVAIFGPVLVLRALVLFTPHATHRQACRSRGGRHHDQSSYCQCESQRVRSGTTETVPVDSAFINTKLQKKRIHASMKWGKCQERIWSVSIN